VDLLKGIRHLLYDQGYTIKGVQKLLKQNGNKFVVAIGSGDASAFEALAKALSDEKERDVPVVHEDDQLLGRARAPANRRFFGLGADAKPASSAEPRPAAGAPVSQEDRALLQEALYDLLECKRLLDQVR